MFVTCRQKKSSMKKNLLKNAPEFFFHHRRQNKKKLCPYMNYGNKYKNQNHIWWMCVCCTISERCWWIYIVWVGFRHTDHITTPLSHIEINNVKISGFAYGFIFFFACYVCMFIS